ncbi:AAA family ATPase [Thalassotalea agarivorans]|uniref:Adenylate kinase n=1 Tax=Thalassotalea agarivorans TaxID=349064 RepID=A0A1I0CL50_THASX|nr:AAA family ATPase [Thalassotalea agarivorans]SET20187.1 Adenylate kinase [Thalassotalea agarivorans]
MKKIIVFGNSGSGKSTFAKHLATKNQLAHLDLDTLAWSPTKPPTRLPLEVSKQQINAFMNENNAWVIEGCYSDLLALVSEPADTAIFLNLSIEQCIENAKNRPWEPHKYATKAAQDENLSMLIDWIEQYASRTDTFSLVAHQKLHDSFTGEKVLFTENQILT